ncbi:unnamed protein product [Schistocephalus solidus]|uniref:Hexosyltransferase n=1 Tax=Schistocephalus solidus TaxID=70667 RepID=A0A183T2K5_SCHSO|nr:unnamed protein product [Schistocephalus solidus]
MLPRTICKLASSTHKMNRVEARRLGLLVGFAVVVLHLLWGFTLPQGSQGHRRSIRPYETPLSTDTSEVNATSLICSSEQPYDIALCLPDSDALSVPPLVELSCRQEGDLVSHGGQACLSFTDLRSRTYEFWSRLKGRTAFQLYPQDLPAREVVRRVKRGLPIGVKSINNPRLAVLKVSKTVCTEEQRGKEVYRFLVIVKSATKNFQARSRLREFIHNQTSRLPFPVGLLFSMGLPRELHEMESNEPVLQNLRTESELFDDILLTNFMDTYDNLTLKTIINLRFAHTICRGVSTQFVILDDDYGISLQGLLDSLTSFSRSDLLRHAFGIVNPSSTVIRSRGHKWALDRAAFPYDIFPNYMSGFCYVIGAQAIEALSIVAAFTKPLRLEDAYIGIMAAKLNMSLHTISGIFLHWPPADTTIAKVVAPIEYFLENR